MPDSTPANQPAQPDQSPPPPPLSSSSQSTESPVPQQVREQLTAPTIPATPQRPNEWQVGVSASQMGLNRFGKQKNKTVVWALVKGITVLVLLFVLIEAGLYAHTYIFGTTQKQLANGGYNYSFTFYNYSANVQLSNGSYALKYKYRSQVIAGVQPTNDQTLTQCSQIGSQWRLAFTAQVAGNPIPVCTSDSSAFVMYFTADNHNQLFTVVYNGIQPMSDYPKINAIFSSVNVSSS